MKSDDLQRFYLLASLSSISLDEGIQLKLSIQGWYALARFKVLDHAPEVLLDDTILELMVLDSFENFSKLYFSGYLGELTYEELTKSWVNSFLSYILATIEEDENEQKEFPEEHVSRSSS